MTLDQVRGSVQEEAARPALRSRRVVLLSVAASCVIILLGPAERITDDPAGLWLMIGAPACVYFGTARRVVSTRDGAALTALGFALLHDIVVLLGLDLLLPVFGDRRPLELIPITLALGVTTIIAGAFVPEADRLAREQWWWHRRGYGPVLGLGLPGVVLSVAGAIRLNNGFGSGVSITAMVVLVATLLLLLFRPGYSIAAVELGIYLAAAAILLLTSLRGWLITGHDIQTEFTYFSNALESGRWIPGASRNAYDACLSVTLLPVAFARVTAISDVNVFKVVMPLLFAATPVLLFRSVRNVASHAVAVLSAVFFIIFPTFSTDMTYMARQEIAFVLVGCAMVVVTSQGAGLSARRIAFGALMAGVVLSHYSTAYIVIIVCCFAAAADAALTAWRKVRGRSGRARGAGGRKRRVSRVRAGTAKVFVPWWFIAFAAAAAFVWAGPVTRTGSQVQSTVTAAISQLEGKASSGYFASQQTDAQLLGGYKQSAVTLTAQDRAKGVYWPLSLVAAYNTPTVGVQYQPLTSVGRRLQNAGIDVSSGNVLARSLDDRAYELFIVAGLAGVWFAGRRLFAPTKDQVLLSLGALGMLGVLTVVPQLSVDYGILRAFQEGMFFFAPFMAAGLIWIFGGLKRWASLAAGVSVAVIASTMTGVVPQLTGGYLGILAMADEGQYYDIHYPTATERTGAQWLNALVGTEKLKTGTAPVVQTDFYTYDTNQTVFSGPMLPDILPQWLRPGSYVLLGATVIRDGEVTNRINGRMITYKYPGQVLDTYYNRIYASSGAEVYGPEMNN